MPDHKPDQGIKKTLEKILQDLEKEGKERQQIDDLCRTLADAQKDLSPEEKNLVQSSCNREGLAYRDAAQDHCETAHQSNRLFKGIRRDRCERRQMNDLRPHLQIFTAQQAEELRTQRPVQPAPEEIQRKKELIIFALQGLSPAKIRELGLPVPPDILEELEADLAVPPKSSSAEVPPRPQVEARSAPAELSTPKEPLEGTPPRALPLGTEPSSPDRASKGEVLAEESHPSPSGEFLTPAPRKEQTFREQGNVGLATKVVSDATGFHLLAFPTRRPGDVVCNRSTSLVIPDEVKLQFQEAFGAKTALYYQAIGIYERVFAEGVKRSCKKVQGNLNCETVTAPAFHRFLYDPDRANWKQYTILRPAKAPGADYKLWDSVYYTLFNTIKGMEPLLEKLTRFTDLLGEFRNQYAVGSYLLTGHLPYSFKRQVAEAWGVTPKWVRNTTFGWRRKLDSQSTFQTQFPAFQINQVVTQTQTLKDELLNLLKGSGFSLTKAMLGALNLLQKYHLLHLLFWAQEFPRVPYLINQEAWKEAEQLRRFFNSHLLAAQRKALLTTAYPTPLALSEAEFQASAAAIIQEVDNTLTKLQQELVTTQASLAQLTSSSAERDNLESEVNRQESRYKALKRFQNICKLLNDAKLRTQFGYLFQFLLPASRQLRALASAVASFLPPWGGKPRKVLGPLGAILSRACLLKFTGGPANVVAMLQPLMTAQVLLTAPFCGKNRRKQMQPLELPSAFAEQPFPPLYVQEPTILREQLDLDKAPKDRRSPKQIVRGIRPGLIFRLPASQTKEAWNVIKTAEKGAPQKGGKRAVVPPELAENEGFAQIFTKALPMKARFTKDMVYFLQRGARLSPPRVLPPRGPNHKMVVNLLFHGEGSLFQKNPQFYDMTYHRQKGAQTGPTVSQVPPRPLEKGRLVGLDINRISTKDILKFATPTAAVKSDAECVQVHLLRTKLSRMRNNPRYKAAGQKHPTSQFGRVWKAIIKAENRHSPKLGRLKAERTLLYERYGNLKQALDREVSLAGARVLITQGAEVLAVEELDLDPRGKAGRLGATITDMPKRSAITNAMVAGANRYHIVHNKWHSPTAQPDLVPVTREPVPAFGTSHLCPDCGSKLVGTKDYDIMHCPKCEKDWNRHLSGAQIVAQRGQDKIQKRIAYGLL